MPIALLLLGSGGSLPRRRVARACGASLAVRLGSRRCCRLTVWRTAPAPGTDCQLDGGGPGQVPSHRNVVGSNIFNIASSWVSPRSSLRCGFSCSSQVRHAVMVRCRPPVPAVLPHGSIQRWESLVFLSALSSTRS